MIGADVLGACVVAAFVLLVIAVVLQARIRPALKLLLIVGLLLRVAGSQAYYYLNEQIYGFGDYTMYYDVGKAWGEAWSTGALDDFHSPFVVGLTGTAFTVRMAGIVLALLGPSVNGVFVVFALFGYLGVIAIAVAFARAHPGVPLERYLAWVILFPSLWYWPAGLGKDALMLGGIGLAVLGYIGRRGHIQVLPLVAGVAMAFAVRPQVAVVLLTAMVLAHWLGSGTRWTLSRILQGILLLGGSVALADLAGETLGMRLFDPQEARMYLEMRSYASAAGGSAVEGGPLAGVVNVLLRPFPWDVHGLGLAIAAAEIACLWALVIWKRSDIAYFFRTHRKSRLVRFSMIFTAMYVLLTGMALGNLGLIARQRILIFPFLFVFFAGKKNWQGVLLAGDRPAV